MRGKAQLETSAWEATQIEWDMLPDFLLLGLLESLHMTGWELED